MWLKNELDCTCNYSFIVQTLISTIRSLWWWQHRVLFQWQGLLVKQQIVLWEISQTWTRASVWPWTVGPIDSPEDQIWSKTRESSDCAFIIWEMLTHSNPDNVPNQKEVICLNSNRTPKSFSSSSTNWAYWWMFQAAEKYYNDVSRLSHVCYICSVWTCCLV